MPPRKPPFKLPFRHGGGHNSASVQSNGSSTSRYTSSSNKTGRSSVRSLSVATAVPSRPLPQARRGPLFESESTQALSANGHEDDDSLNEIVMAVDLLPRGAVGCCYYVARDEKMFFMEDIQFGNVDIIETLSTNIDDSVTNKFDPEGKSDVSASFDNDQFRLSFLLEVRPPSEFYYDAARRKLQSLPLEGAKSSRVSFNVPGELATTTQFDDENTLGQQGQLLRLAGWIDLDSRVTVTQPVLLEF
ncbi:hypothetical protein J1614_009147 [Plenodomus biglobosus]|nr:hypothetical protein J1614_009147 [Plenodomus biglobosus]